MPSRDLIKKNVRLMTFVLAQAVNKQDGPEVAKIGRAMRDTFQQGLESGLTPDEMLHEASCALTAGRGTIPEGVPQHTLGLVEQMCQMFRSQPHVMKKLSRSRPSRMGITVGWVLLCMIPAPSLQGRGG